MPWEKSFDTDEILDRATSVFWAKGYEATSMADLLEATGINKGSLYNAFGSKQEIFKQAILRYDREQRQATIAKFKAMNDPVTAISEFFDAMIDDSLSDEERKGCLLVNTALDLPNQNDDVAEAIKAGMKHTEAFFTQQIKLGKSNGDIPDHVDPKKAAKGLLTLVTGLRVLARGVFGKADLAAIKAQALELIK